MGATRLTRRRPTMKTLAAETGRTEGSLYQLLARTRLELLRCVERTLALESPSMNQSELDLIHQFLNGTLLRRRCPQLQSLLRESAEARNNAAGPVDRGHQSE